MNARGTPAAVPPPAAGARGHGRARRVITVAALLVGMLVSALASPRLGIAQPSGSSSRPTQLLALRGHFGGFHLGGGAFSGRSSRYGRYGRYGSRHTLRRVVHTLAFAYLLHLFFSHGGFSVLLWLVLIWLVVHGLRRRRRRRSF